jgi:DNA end-binding protein Ku
VAAIAEDKPRTNVIDLMAALEESVAARTGRGGAQSGSKAAKKAAKTAKSKSSSKDAAAELAGMSKADLLKEAGRLDIKGRSAMTKDELVEAIASMPARARSAAS